MQTLWDPELRLPIPPIDTVYPSVPGFWAAMGYLALVVPVALYALWHIRERKGVVMLLMMVGGTLCAFVEPFADLIGGCYHPEINQPTALDVLGRKIAWWSVAGYASYFGAISAINYLWYSKGITRRTIWIAFIVPIFVDIGMENAFLHYDLYYYYGNQPLAGFGYLPLWWPPINALGVFSGVVALILLNPYLKGWRLLFIPLVAPTMDLVSYALLSYPAAMAVNNPSLGPVPTQLAGLYSWAMALLVVHGITYLLASDSPLRKGNTLVLPLKLGDDEPSSLQSRERATA